MGWSRRWPWAWAAAAALAHPRLKGGRALVAVVLIVCCIGVAVALEVLKRRRAANASEMLVLEQSSGRPAVAGAGAPAGWYPDPYRTAAQRYYDPAQGGWTGHTA